MCNTNNPGPLTVHFKGDTCEYPADMSLEEQSVWNAAHTLDMDEELLPELKTVSGRVSRVDPFKSTGKRESGWYVYRDNSSWYFTIFTSQVTREPRVGDVFVYNYRSGKLVQYAGMPFPRP